tara:strand:+ start:796 stop:1677 length:882 start_codon:yes stop_codon:yes gene_type:complete
MKELSIIVPVYNEENNIEKFIVEVEKNIPPNCEYEILFCMDPSSDNTEKVLLDCKIKYKNIKIIKLSRRFGQALSIKAGLYNCVSNYIIIIDVDLQDPPSLIPKLYSKIKDGDYECVYARRRSRAGESNIRKILVSIYYFLVNRFADNNLNIPTNVGECRIISKKFLDKLKENDRGDFIRGDVPFIGLKQSKIDFDREERKFGKSKYLIGSIKGAIIGLLNFSYLFLLISIFGAIISFVSGIMSLLFGINSSYFIFFGIMTIIFIGFVILLYLKSIFNKISKNNNFIIDRIID